MNRGKNYPKTNFNHDDYINELNMIIYNKNHKILSLENEIYSKNKKILNLKEKNFQSITNKNNEISKLKKKNKKLNKQKKEILSSSSWKLTSPIRKVKYYLKNIRKLFKRKKSKKLSSIRKSGFKKKNIKENKKLSLKQLYLEIYNASYYYNTYFISEDFKRINLFFNEIDSTIFELNYLFKFLIEYCNNYEYSLRIIYNNADFSIFNDFLKKFKLILPNCSFLNLKEDNYLEIGLNEKYICTSWLNARQILNTSSINSEIYFYLTDLKECTFDEHFQISKICYNNRVIILNDNFDKLKDLRKFNYNFDMEINGVDKKNKVLCCDFGNMHFEGFELLTYLFFNKILNFNEWAIVIQTNFDFSKKYFDFYGITIPIYNEFKDSDLLLKFDFNNNYQPNQENYIKIYFEDEIDENYSVLDIIDLKSIDIFDKYVPSKKYSYNQHYLFEEIFNKLDEVQ